MEELSKIKVDDVIKNKDFVEERLEIRRRYENIYRDIGQKDHVTYFKEILAQGKKDLKWNFKAKKKYSNIKEYFLDKTIADYFVMAQAAMYGIFTDIVSYRDWTEDTADIGIKKEKTPLLNITLFLKKYFNEWKDYTEQPEYEAEFCKRFEERFGHPHYSGSVSQLRAINIKSLCRATVAYYEFIHNELDITEEELYSFMNNEKFVGFSNTNDRLWDIPRFTYIKKADNEKIDAEEDIDIFLNSSDEENEVRRKEQSISCLYFEVFTYAKENPQNNMYAVDFLKCAFEYKYFYGMTLCQREQHFQKSELVNNLLKTVTGYLEY